MKFLYPLIALLGAVTALPTANEGHAVMPPTSHPEHEVDFSKPPTFAKEELPIIRARAGGYPDPDWFMWKAFTSGGSWCEAACKEFPHHWRCHIRRPEQCNREWYGVETDSGETKPGRAKVKGLLP